MYGCSNKVFANPTATRLCGAASFGETLAQEVVDLSHPVFREFVQPRINLVYGGEHEKLQEMSLMRLAGHKVNVEIMALAISYQGLPAPQMVLTWPPKTAPHIR